MLVSLTRRPSARALPQSPNVERRDRPVQSFQCQLAGGFDLGEGLDRALNLAVHQDLSVARLATQPSRKIHDGADRRVVEPALEPDRAQRRVALGNANPEA